MTDSLQHISAKNLSSGSPIGNQLDSPTADCSLLRPLKIGKVTVANNLILAPMSGVTNSCFRRLVRAENGAALGLVMTEFVSIEGLTRQNAQSMRMMSFVPEEQPIAIQIFGHSIERMSEAARMVEDSGAQMLDINCGCPVPKVVKRGGGCELMRQPDHLAKILNAVRSAIKIPLTLKIRSGWDESSKNALEIGRMAQECGVEMLTIHGRTRSALYRGVADWQVVRSAAETLSIPVVGSGDIVDLATAREALKSGVAGVMIGRAALSNPWVFKEIVSGLLAQDYEAPGDQATVDVLERYLELLIAGIPPKAVVGRMKQLASQVTRRVYGSTPARKAICTANSVEEIKAILREWREFLGERECRRNQTAEFVSSFAPKSAEASFDRGQLGAVG